MYTLLECSYPARKAIVGSRTDLMVLLHPSLYNMVYHPHRHLLHPRRGTENTLSNEWSGASTAAGITSPPTTDYAHKPQHLPKKTKNKTHLAYYPHSIPLASDCHRKGDIQARLRTTSTAAIPITIVAPHFLWPGPGVNGRYLTYCLCHGIGPYTQINSNSSYSVEGLH